MKVYIIISLSKNTCIGKEIFMNFRKENWENIRTSLINSPLAVNDTVYGFSI